MKLSNALIDINENIILYENVFSNLPFGICLYDSYGQCYFATKAAANLIGAKCVDDVLKQNFHNISSWKKTELYSTAIKSLETGEIIKINSFLKSTFGKDLWLESTFIPLISKNETHLQLIISDITEIKLKELYYIELSLYDSLTGIHNRRCFDERIDIEIQRCNRSGKPFSLILIDIDYFKLLNDNYGHQKGDECLILVANTIKESLMRKSDLVARYGGEEFICLLPYTDSEGAFVVAEIIQRNINKLNIPNINSKVKSTLTVSQGISTIYSDSKIDSKTFLNNTDTALYHAKNKGRNLIMVFSNALLESKELPMA